MSKGTLKKIVQNYYETMWDGRDIAKVSSFYHKNAVLFGNLGIREGVEEIADAKQTWFNKLYKLKTELHSLLEDGDDVLMHWRVTATKIGKVPEIPIKGKELLIMGADRFTFRGHKVDYQWSFLRFCALEDDPEAGYSI